MRYRNNKIPYPISKFDWASSKLAMTETAEKLVERLEELPEGEQEYTAELLLDVLNALQQDEATVEPEPPPFPPSRKFVARQAATLQAVTATQRSVQTLLNLTLKATCPECGEELELTVRQSSTKQDYLQLKCRNSNCSGNQPSWKVDNIL